MIMGFDYTKPVRQKNGRAARVVDTNVKNDRYGLAVVFIDPDGKETSTGYGKDTGSFWGDGSRGLSSDRDLENIPERHSWWVNVYESKGHGNTCATREEAKKIRNNAKYILEMIYEDDKLVEVIKHDVTHD
jgi:hypothetical protein